MKLEQRLVVAAAVLLLAACAPREVLFPALGLDAPKLDLLPADFESPRSYETEQPMPGFGGGGGGVHQVPVIWIHGNTVSATFWLPARQYFLEQGYTQDETWALSYGWDNPRYFDSTDLSVPSVDRIVNAVTNYLTQLTGEPVQQVDVIGHSLGVTLVRQWMKQTNSYHRVRNFIGVAGANDGVWTAWNDTRGQQRGVSWELFPDSPWLKQLSAGGETPGPTRYMMLYDGSGWGDVLFPTPLEDSGSLEGANNVAFNREHGMYLDHLELPRAPETMAVMLDWVAKAPVPDDGARRPVMRQTGRLLTASQPGALIHCTDDGSQPDRQTPGTERLLMTVGPVYSCYPQHPETQLAGPIERFAWAGEQAPAREAPSLQIEPAGGVFEHPVEVTLSSDDPDAFIVYNTSGTPIETGSPLYREPVYVAGPVRFTAMAVGPDGQRSDPVTVEFDISLELVEARHTLQRQFNPETPVNYAGDRKKGR